MNPLDILMIVIFIYCLTMGIFRGPVRELASIIGVLGGYFAACMYYATLVKYLSKLKWISDPSYLDIVSFLIIFSCIFLIISVIGIIIKYLLKIANHGWLDRVSGGGLGAVKGILIVSVLLVNFTAFLKDGAPIIKNSLFAPHVTLISEQMAKVVSKKMKQKYEVKAEHFKKAWGSKKVPEAPKSPKVEVQA